jgi:hypothetical protein
MSGQAEAKTFFPAKRVLSLTEGPPGSHKNPPFIPLSQILKKGDKEDLIRSAQKFGKGGNL